MINSMRKERTRCVDSPGSLTLQGKFRKPAESTEDISDQNRPDKEVNGLSFGINLEYSYSEANQPRSVGIARLCSMMRQ